MNFETLTVDDVIPHYYDIEVPLGVGGIVKDLLDYILEPARTVRFKSQPFGEVCTLRVWLDIREVELVRDIFDANTFIGNWTLKLTDLNA